jgi:hypothetical protein
MHKSYRVDRQLKGTWINRRADNLPKWAFTVEGGRTLRLIWLSEWIG